MAVVVFGFQAASVFSGLDKLEKRLEKVDAAVEKLTGVDLGSWAGGLSLAGLAAFTKGAADEISGVVDAADKLNSTPETIQRVQKAVEVLGGTELDTVTAGLIKLRKELIEDPESDLSRQLREFNVEGRTFLGLDIDQQILALADAYEQASAKGTALPLLTGALGKKYAELIPLLANGREELQAFFDATAVIGNAGAMHIDKLNDRFDIMTGKVMFLGKSLALSLGQGLADLFGGKSRAVDPTGGAAENETIKQAAAEKRAAEAAAAVQAASVAREEESRKKLGKLADEAFEKAEKLNQAQQRVDEVKRKAGLDAMTLGKRIATLAVEEKNAAEEEAMVRADFAPDAERLVAIELRRVTIQAEMANLQRQYTADKEREAEAQTRAAEQAAKAAQQATEAAATRRAAVVDTALEYELLKARANGNEREVEAIERKVRVMERARSLEADNGLDRQAALSLAEKMTALEDKAERRENGGRGKIRSLRDGSTVAGMAGADAERLKGRSAWDRLQKSGSAFDRLQGKPSAWDQLQKGPSAWDRLQGKAGANAVDPAPKQAGGAESLLDKIFQQFPKALAEAIVGAAG